MSVATHSPLLCGTKRLFQEASPPDLRAALDEGCSPAHSAGYKRYRRAGSRPHGLQYLVELFPRMDGQVISSVLDECGCNIDAAIKRLGELQLAKESTEQEAGAASATPTPPQQATGTPPPEPAEAQGAEIRSGEDWVDLVVAEMSSATDLSDAKARAARVLQSFEAQVQAVQRQSADKDAKEAAASQVAELLRDNAILKKAVQIQNSRMQEVAEKETQLSALQQLLAQHQEKIRALELSNYSLTLHLRQAESSPMPQHRNPDVF